MLSAQPLALNDSVQTAVSASPASSASLTLGHILSGMGADHEPGIRLEGIHVIRHALKPGSPGALQGPEDLTVERVLEYTRTQAIEPRRFPAAPPRYCVVFIADGKQRSRLWGASKTTARYSTDTRKGTGPLT